MHSQVSSLVNRHFYGKFTEDSLEIILNMHIRIHVLHWTQLDSYTLYIIFEYMYAQHDIDVYILYIYRRFGHLSTMFPTHRTLQTETTPSIFNIFTIPPVKLRSNTSKHVQLYDVWHILTFWPDEFLIFDFAVEYYLVLFKIDLIFWDTQSY